MSYWQHRVIHLPDLDQSSQGTHHEWGLGQRQCAYVIGVHSVALTEIARQACFDLCDITKAQWPMISNTDGWAGVLDKAVEANKVQL